MATGFSVERLLCATLVKQSQFIYIFFIITLYVFCFISQLLLNRIFAYFGD